MVFLGDSGHTTPARFCRPIFLVSARKVRRAVYKSFLGTDRRIRSDLEPNGLDVG